MRRIRSRIAVLPPLAGLLTLLACGGSSSAPATDLPRDASFGEVDVGGSAARRMTITNTTTSPLTLTEVSTSDPGLVASGDALPLTIAPGETASVSVELAPTTAGDVSGTIEFLTADEANPVAVFRATGRGVRPNKLATSGTNMSFGDVTLGSTAVEEVTLTNGGTTPVSIASLAVSAAGVTATGLPLPATFAPGESATLTLTYAPTTVGPTSGSVAVRSEQGRPVSVVEISGNGVSPTPEPTPAPATPATLATLAAAPTRIDFGQVTVGSFSALGVTLTNSTSEPITVSEVMTTGSGFTASGVAAGTTLAAGASATLTTRFTPAAQGTASGQVMVRTASQTEPLAVVDLAGSGVAAASITSVTVRDTTVETSKTVQVQADVVAVGTIDKSLTWSVDPASLGTIDPVTGVYSAPAASGTYRVWATSNADPSKADAGTVTVTAPALPTTPAYPAAASTLDTCSGLVSHTDPVTRPSLAMPAYNAADPSASWVIDPVFGTKITRVTGNPGNAVPGLSGRTWKTIAGPLYPKTPAWNADGSLLMVMGVDSGFLIVDGNTYKPLVFRGGVPGYSVPDFRWHPRDPRYFIVVEEGGKVGLFNPIDNTVVWKFDPGVGVFRGASIGFAEGNVSNDGSRVAVTATRVSDGRTVVFGVDLALGRRISPVIAADELGMPTFDWATISPLGDYILASSPWTPGLNRTIRLDGSCATTFSTACIVATWYHMGHYDVGLLGDGTTQVAFNAGEPSYVRLDDPSGARVYLAASTYGNYYHSSTRNVGVPGWGFASLDWTGGPLNGEIFAQELREGGRVRRFAYTYRSSTTDYEHQTDATPSPDGTRVFFRSDWGNASGPVYGFIADARDLCN
jgi:hypothetical protein